MDMVVGMGDRKLETVFADGILQSMSDGVLVLGDDGKVAAFNAAAAAIIGRDDMGEDFSLAQLMIEDERNDAFVQVLLDSVFDGVTIHDRVVPFVPEGGEERTLSVTASHLRSDEGGLKGAFIVLCDITEVEDLRESKTELTEELQKALRVADDKANELESALKHGQRIRNWATIGVIVLFVGLGIFYFMGDTSIDVTPDHSMSADSGDSRTLTVTPRPLTRSISLSGIVAPLEEVALSAPFKGRVENKQFFYGDRVARGQTLCVISTGEIEAEVREARADFIKAKKKYIELDQWDKTPDVSKARRDVSQAKSQLSQAESKLKEDKTLLDAGIIPRSEYESTLQDLEDKKMQFTSSRENLRAVLDKGDSDYFEIAQMELENARAKMEAAEAKLAKATITAPVDGIAIQPVPKDKEETAISTGMVVTEGQTLVSVASVEGLSITTEVDELDINSLETGQPVKVTGDAFPGISLNGRIAQLSSRANDGQVPTFTATIRLRDLPDHVEDKVRLGMTANMAVQTYSNPKALLVPLSAVSRAGGKEVVHVSDKDGTVHEVEVKTGFTTLTEVEILSGLKAGDTIVVR